MHNLKDFLKFRPLKILLVFNNPKIIDYNDSL